VLSNAPSEGGIKIIRKDDAGYDSDAAAGAVDCYIEKPIDGAKLVEDVIDKLYSYRIKQEQHNKLQAKFKKFIGTKCYHNYTRDLSAKMSQSKRHMIKLDATELRYFNRDTLEPSNKEDPRAIEFVHFWIKGQSFLYNQIRKMIGVMIQIFRGQMDEDFMDNTMNENKMDISLAPGEGLMLEKVCYDAYNKASKCKEPIQTYLVKQNEEAEEFRVKLIQHMIRQETEEKRFSKWLIQFDERADEFYVNLRKKFRPEEQTS
jgi:tRNA pseudouridine38-40 synthase